MIEILGPDGVRNQFPDGTDDETIKRVMRKQYGGPSGASGQAGSTASKAAAPPDLEATQRGLQVLVNRNARDQVYDRFAKNQGFKTKEDMFAAVGNPSTQSSKSNMEMPTVAPGGFWPAATDIARSAATGIGQGALAVAGLPGDIKSGVDWAMNKILPMSPEQQAAMNSTPLTQPTTSQLRAGTEAAIGPFYQPQSTAGQIFKSIGEFVPSAATGPGGAVRKIAMAVVPGVATEAAQAATAGTPAEDLATIAAGVLGGGVAGMVGRGAGVARAMQKAVPDVEGAYRRILGQTKTAYDQLENMGIKYDANAWQTTVKDAATELNKKGFRPYQGNAPGGHQILDEMTRLAGTSPTYADVESLRKAAGNLARNFATPSDAEMGRKLKDVLDDFTVGSASMTQTGHSTPEIEALKRQARSIAQIKIKAQDLIQARNVGMEGYVSGDVSGLRRQFASVGRDIAKRTPPGTKLGTATVAGYTPAEQAAIRGVKTGSQGQRVAQAVGSTGAEVLQSSGRSNWGPMGQAATAAGIGAWLGGPIGAAAGLVGQQAFGIGAKALAARSTKQAAENAIRTVLAGPGAQSAAVQKRVQDLVRLFASQGINLDIAANRPPRSLEFTVGPKATLNKTTPGLLQ